VIIGVMTLHSLSECVGVGVSYGGGAELGAFITIVIAIHNIPEGLAISLVLVPEGRAWLRRPGGAFFESASAAARAVGVPVRRAVRPLLSVGLGFAAGAMVWLVFAELLPTRAQSLSCARCSSGLAGRS
jgi:zinc transporter, ZIP family